MSAQGQGTAFPSVALTPLRLVVGWMFFSAFHRRVILEPDKLSPDVAGYVGEKFNQFMPGAIWGVGDLIGALLDRPSALLIFLWTFTIIEALVGAALLLGVASRLASWGVVGLSLGILLGAGWLGPTCLDEWQIGSMGVAGGAALLLGGAGSWSVDAWLLRKRPQIFEHVWVRWIAHPSPAVSVRWAGGWAGFALALTLLTNQIFHGGVWGTLHNDSVKPRVDVLAAELTLENHLQLTLERPVGPETYGSFLVELRVLSERGEKVWSYDAEQLSSIPAENIQNRWLVQVKPGAHSLVIPLGAQAQVRLPGALPLSPGSYQFELEDVSGAVFRSRAFPLGKVGH